MGYFFCIFTFQHNQPKRTVDKIILSTANNIHKVVDLEHVIFIKGKYDYSIAYFTDRRPLTTIRCLKDIESKIGARYLFRINRQTIVNLRHLKKFQSIQSTIKVELCEDIEFTVSRSRIQAFKERLKELYGCL
jgi:DNA-binding LytR/AlgR family response regulator